MEVSSKARQKIKENMSIWLENFGCPDSYRNSTSQHMMEDVIDIIEKDAPKDQWKASNQ